MFISNVLELESEVIRSYVFEERYFVVLKQTPFYPQGGGQLCDLGYLNEIRVLDVFYHEGEIVHEVEKEVTGRVLCQVDELRRFNNSMLHTAQHLLSAVFEQSDVGSSSFYMRDDGFVIDVLKAYNRNELNEFEKKINSCILDGNRVYIRDYDEVVDSEMNVTAMIGEFEQLKLVIIEGIDKCLCGGTHLDSLKELKFLKIVNYKVIKEKTRIEVCVGDSAYDYVNKYFDGYDKIIQLVKQREPDVYDLIQSKLKENKKFKKELKTLQRVVEQNGLN